MTTVNVQFAGTERASILSVFSAPQDPSVYDNLGTVDLGDPIYASWYEALPANIRGWWPAPLST